MFNSINLRFSVSASKANKAGFAPLALSIIVNGERTYVLLPRKLRPADFNAKRQTTSDYEINDFMSIVKSKILQIHTQLLALGEPITAEIIKANFLGKDTSKQWKILELYIFHFPIELNKYIDSRILLI